MACQPCALLANRDNARGGSAYGKPPPPPQQAVDATKMFAACMKDDDGVYCALKRQTFNGTRFGDLCSPCWRRYYSQVAYASSNLTVYTDSSASYAYH